MSGGDEDDKPTVVLDLNALKKQKLLQEEELASIASELEFAVEDEKPLPPSTQAAAVKKITVLLVDLQSDFFEKAKASFPTGFDYKIVKTLPELNQHLKSKESQIAVFNYDSNPKAAGQLCAQMKQKFPLVKTIIMAKSISPEKAKAHAATPQGAHGYYQLPINAEKVLREFQKLQAQFKKTA